MVTDSRIKCCPDGLIRDRRSQVKILDCTIRDGGICNNWNFDHKTVSRVFQSLTDAGVDYMEIGYLTRPDLFTDSNIGPWRFCRREDLDMAVRPGSMKLSCMVDVGRVTAKEIPPKKESPIDAIRIATYAHQMEQAIELLDHCLEMGYETFMNVMAVSTLSPEKVDAFLFRLAQSGVENVAIVDSYGALYPYHIRYLIRKYGSILGQGIRLGVHCHNNQQQAFANSIAAIEEGIDFVDATIYGMGRGAGNCPLELLLMYMDQPRYDVAKILGLIEEFDTIRDELRWGYQVPYVISGYHNIHPSAAIDHMGSSSSSQVKKMYENISGRFTKKKTG
jgi:4-hydroxy 2-oxovalerate aldolase